MEYIVIYSAAGNGRDKMPVSELQAHLPAECRTRPPIALALATAIAGSFIASYMAAFVLVFAGFMLGATPLYWANYLALMVALPLALIATPFIVVKIVHSDIYPRAVWRVRLIDGTITPLLRPSVEGQDVRMRSIKALYDVSKAEDWQKTMSGVTKRTDALAITGILTTLVVLVFLMFLFWPFWAGGA